MAINPFFLYTDDIGLMNLFVLTRETSSFSRWKLTLMIGQGTMHERLQSTHPGWDVGHTFPIKAQEIMSKKKQKDCNTLRQ